MTLDVFEYLSNKLPREFQQWKVTAELDMGYLQVRTVPGDAHERVSHRFTDVFIAWANAGYQGYSPPMENCGSAGIPRNTYVFS